MWMHPLPVREEEKAIVFARLLFYWLPNSKYRLYIRQDRYRLYGLVSDINFNVHDKGKGHTVPYIEGFFPNGGNILLPKLEMFKEPRLRTVPMTGRDDDTIIEVNDSIAVTKRKTDSYDDVDENFVTVFGEHQAEQYGDLIKRVNVLETNNHDLSVLVKDYSDTISRQARDLDALTITYERTRKAYTRLQQQNELLATEKETFRMMNKQMTVDHLRGEGRLTAMEEHAYEQGNREGLPPIQSISQSAEEIKVLMDTLNSMSRDVTVRQDAQVQAEVKNMFNNLMDKLARDERNTYAPPPPQGDRAKVMHKTSDESRDMNREEGGETG